MFKKIINYSNISTHSTWMRNCYYHHHKRSVFTTTGGTVNSPLNTKIFIQHENQYAHNILKSNPKYNVYRPLDTISISPQPDVIHLDSFLKECVALPAATTTTSTDDNNSTTSTENSSELLNTFKTLALHCHLNNIQITNDIFNDYVDMYIDKMQDFPDELIMETLKSLQFFPETKSINVRNFSELWEALDDICYDRMGDWDIDKLLFVCDLWYNLRLAKVSKFVKQCIKRIGRSVKKLPPEQLVQTMFYSNLLRTSFFDVIHYEQNIMRSIDQFTIDDIAILSMGFFKTQVKIKNIDLINQFYKRLLTEVNQINDISLVSILKILRYSSVIPNADQMKILLDALTPQIPRFSLLTCVHVALLGSDIQLYHHPSLEAIIQRFINEHKNARLKDLERICFVMSLCNIQTSNSIEKKLCKIIINELKERITEITNHPKCFVYCLHYLTLNNCSDNELLSSVFDLKFIKFTYGTNLTLGKELFHLDAYTRINLHGNYNGLQLPDKFRKTMARILVNYIPQKDGKKIVPVTDRILLEVNKTLTLLSYDPYIKHSLPHYERPENVICIDRKTKKSYDLGKFYPEDYSSIILSKDYLIKDERIRNDLDLIMIIIGGWNNYVRGTTTLTGLMELKVKQAELIGYKTTVVPWNEWTKLLLPEKSIYLKIKISSLLQDE